MKTLIHNFKFTISYYSLQFHISHHNFISFFTISFHSSQFHFILHNFISFFTISFHSSQFHFILHNFISFFTISFHSSQFHFILHNFISFFTISFHSSQFHSSQFHSRFVFLSATDWFRQGSSSPLPVNLIFAASLHPISGQSAPLP